MSMKNILFIFTASLLFISNLSAKPLIFVTLDNPPVEYIFDNQVVGRNIDVVREVCRRLQLTCKIRLVPWKRGLLMVQNGSADAIIDAAFSPERAEYMFYPKEELQTEEWYAFKRAGSRITLDGDFSNTTEIRLGTTQGFHYGGSIQKAIDQQLFKSIETVHSNELNILKVIGGRFDMFIGVKSSTVYLARQMGYYDQIDIVRKTGTQQDFLLSASKTYVGFSKKNMTSGFTDKFSLMLKNMKTDGTLEQIDKKYR